MLRTFRSTRKLKWAVTEIRRVVILGHHEGCEDSLNMTNVRQCKHVYRSACIRSGTVECILNGALCDVRSYCGNEQ